MLRLPFSIKPVVENIFSTLIEADDIDKYNSASLFNVRNVVVWRLKYETGARIVVH